jgi:uncharacterized membrane protein YphA (DoxX/SURF4 family)
VKPLPSSRRYAAWLALVRIATGAIWLAHGIPKFTQSGRFMPPGGSIADLVNHAIQGRTGTYHNFLLHVVSPNIGLFAELVRLGEVLVGASLVLGALTRVGGLFGVVLTLNYIAAKGGAFSPATLQGLDFATLVLSAISLVLPTGRFLGIDALFGRARRAAAPVRAEFVSEPPLSGPTAPPNP